MTTSQISKRSARTGAHVAYHLAILESFALIREDGELDGEVLYRAHLEEHPGWVVQMVNDHRPGDGGISA